MGSNFINGREHRCTVGTARAELGLHTVFDLCICVKCGASLESSTLPGFYVRDVDAWTSQHTSTDYPGVTSPSFSFLCPAWNTSSVGTDRLRGVTVLYVTFSLPYCFIIQPYNARPRPASASSLSRNLSLPCPASTFFDLLYCLCFACPAMV